MNESIQVGHRSRDLNAAIVGFHASRSTTRHTPRPCLEDVAEADNGDELLSIRVADNATHRTHASSLIQRRYAWRGYSATPLEEDSSARVTLSACSREATVATLTVGVDSDEGLYVGRLYKDVVERLRGEGRKLCEFTKLAVDESVRSHAVLGAIFHVASMFIINLHRCSDALIEVNPRHVAFYRRMLGFKVEAGERIDPEVNAPAVLLRLDLEHCAREIARLGGQRNSGHAERSFYPYFFAPEEAGKIVRRLRER
jgi:hypothetical protein